MFLFPRWDMVGYVCSLKGTMHDILFTLPVGCFMMLTIFAPSIIWFGGIFGWICARQHVNAAKDNLEPLTCCFYHRAFGGGCSGQHGSVDGAATLGSAHELFSFPLYILLHVLSIYSHVEYIYIFFCLIQSLYLPWYKSMIYIHLPQPLGSVHTLHRRFPHRVEVVEHSSEGTEGRQSWTGRLNLVDLAGSERPRLTGWVGWVGGSFRLPLKDCRKVGAWENVIHIWDEKGRSSWMGCRM